LVGGSLLAFYKRSEALTLITTLGIGNNNHVNKYSMDSYAGIMMLMGFVLAFMALSFLIMMFF